MIGKRSVRKDEIARIERDMSVISEIKKVNEDLTREYENFCMQTDCDLLDASIYRIKELRSRHNYLIKYARENKIEAIYMNFCKAGNIKNA